LPDLRERRGAAALPPGRAAGTIEYEEERKSRAALPLLIFYSCYIVPVETDGNRPGAALANQRFTRALPSQMLQICSSSTGWA
jgi:hypothetical protein